jgi:hypothetical protein
MQPRHVQILLIMDDERAGRESTTRGDIFAVASRSGAPSRTCLALRKAGFDPAISCRMMLDHGFSQPIARRPSW